MNPDLLADGGADFRFNAFNEAHANPVEFIGWPDRGGNFQRGLFHLAPAKVRCWIDAVERICHLCAQPRGLTPDDANARRNAVEIGKRPVYLWR